MPKASPLRRSFSAGEWSRLLDGRSDIQAYAASLRTMKNYVAAPQGPAIGRSGTAFVNTAKDESKPSVLIPFVFDSNDVKVLEVTDTGVRIFTEDGLQTYTSETLTVTSAAGDPIEFTSATISAAVDDQVVLGGFPASYNLNGVVANVTAKSGNDYTLDVSYPNETIVAGTVAKVYITSVGIHADNLPTLRYAQSLDVIYLTSNGMPPSTLSRYGDYDWRLETIEFKDGPFAPVNTTSTTVTPSGTSGTVTMTFSSTTGVNGGDGFHPVNDLGRLIRIQDAAGNWTWGKIVSQTSSTVVGVTIKGPALSSTAARSTWRLGYFRLTPTGYPTAAPVFLEDRLWFVGGEGAPDLVAGSVTGDYYNFSPSQADGTVNDDDAIVNRLNSRRMSPIKWLSTSKRGLLLGTGSEEYEIPTSTNDPLTPRSARARISTRRGSENVSPTLVDDQTLFVQRGGRSVREFAYNYEADGFRSVSMTQLASHLGVPEFAELDYAAEPHSVVWARRNDETLTGLTYNRDESIVGWHVHDFPNAAIESMAVVPNADGTQDGLWMVIRRTVDGNTRRYIERLMPFWDFGFDLEDAHFLDSALRYDGSATDTLYGLQHLEGETVYALVDGRPEGPFVVTNGSVTLPYEGSNVLCGVGFESLGVLTQLDAGGADGTSLGKTQRVNHISLGLWSSFGGEIGVYSEQEEDFIFEPVEYPGNAALIEDVELFTGTVLPPPPTQGYALGAIIAFRRPPESPLPFNVTFIAPQLHTQDR